MCSTTALFAQSRGTVETQFIWCNDRIIGETFFGAGWTKRNPFQPYLQCTEITISMTNKYSNMRIGSFWLHYGAANEMRESPRQLTSRRGMTQTIKLRIGLRTGRLTPQTTGIRKWQPATCKRASSQRLKYRPSTVHTI